MKVASLLNFSYCLAFCPISSTLFSLSLHLLSRSGRMEEGRVHQTRVARPIFHPGAAARARGPLLSNRATRHLPCCGANANVPSRLWINHRSRQILDLPVKWGDVDNEWLETGKRGEMRTS
eukprot:scaffold60710_cov31-Tisochrysis_lutea.AAC.5